MSRLCGGLAGSSQSLGSGIGVGGLGNRVMVSEVVAMVIVPKRPTFTDGMGKLQYTVVLDGAVSFVGDVLKSTKKILDGGITPTGGLVKSTQKLLSGGVSFVGTLLKQTRKILDGSVSPSGVVIRSTTKQVGGSVTPQGDVTATQQPAPPGGSASGILTDITEHAHDTKLT